MVFALKGRRAKLDCTNVALPGCPASEGASLKHCKAMRYGRSLGTRFSCSTDTRRNQFGSGHHERRIRKSNPCWYGLDAFSKHTRRLRQHPRILQVSSMRLERTAFAFAGQRSIQLSYEDSSCLPARLELASMV